MTKRRLTYLLLILLPLTLAADCSGPTEPAPESDSSQSFDADARVPVDDAVYELRGLVVGDVDSLERQSSPGGAHLTGVNGFVSGAAFGPEFTGKGFVRVEVVTLEPDPAEAQLGSEGDVIILKTSDTKASALVPGDAVTFRCRAQYEAVAATREREELTDAHATWEWDYCRLATPGVGSR